MFRADSESVQCVMCERAVPRELITLHHLRPKQKGGRADDRVPVCRPCHKQIHATFTNTQLLRGYDTIPALRQAEPLQPFLKWIRRQNPHRNFRTRMSLSRRGR
jgi:5-methylcytosine-specific restriction enzyme A